MNFNFLKYVEKSTRIKITLNGGIDVIGQYSLITTDNFICIHTDNNLEYEYFELDKIIQVTIPV